MALHKVDYKQCNASYNNIHVDFHRSDDEIIVVIHAGVYKGGKGGI